MKRMVESEIADILNEKLQIDENGIDLKDNLHVDGKISGGEIVEDMSGYSFSGRTPTNVTLSYVYAGAVKNGNKLTLVLAVRATPTTVTPDWVLLGNFTIPKDVWDKLVPAGVAGYTNAYAIESVDFRKYADSPSAKTVMVQQGSQGIINIYVYNAGWTADTEYYGRIEVTFLLSENLAPTA